MKIAKQAVQYYTMITGNEWSTFYDNLDIALSEENPTGDLFIIKRLMQTIVSSGISVNEFKMNKDAVKALFDEEGRKANGEFFTPIVWAKELYTYIDKFIPNWRTEFNIWENSCYSMDTEIFTKRGWVDYLNLKDSDKVFGFDMSTGKTHWVSFHNRFIKKYTGKMFNFCGYDSIAGTGQFDEVYSEARVTADHLMIVKINGVFTKLPACDLFELLKKNFFVPEGKTPDKIELVMYGSDINTYRSNVVVDIPLSYDKCSVEEVQDIDVWDITMDRYHIFLTRRNGNPIFSSNCGSGNLLRESKATMSNVYMSSLQNDDITLVKNTPEFEGVNAFQCDFLEGIDYDIYNTEFLNKLPPRLKEIIVNDEPLLIICNPPYKTGSAKATDVGRYMCEIGMGRPAYDIFYQFCWRVMRFVEMFKLKNCYYAFFGPLTFFTGAGANILLTEFEHSFEFLDGMCISAQEFSDTSESILWGISGSIWKSRGGYQEDQNHKDILLEKKYLLPDGKVGCEGRVLYAPPREKLSDWVAPKDVSFYENAPLMTSHLTFKGSEVFDKIAPKSGRLADNALGTLMVGNTLTRSADQSAILSMPSTIQYVSITEENFWRCVASYAFRRTIDAGWAIAKKEISAPDTTVEGYDLWLKNALVIFLFEYKSMMSSMRGVSWGGYDNYVIRNKLFYLTEEEIRQHCHDEVILKDLDEHPLENQFILEKIKECEPYWSPEIRALYDWCKNYTLFTFDKRKSVNYKGSLDCADAGFQQLRTGGLWNDQLSDELTKIIVQARDYMRKDLDKFGFVSETEDSDL